MKNGASPESELAPIITCLLGCALFVCLRGDWRHKSGTLLGVQFRCLSLMMNCMLTMAVSQVRVMRRLFVLFGLVVFRCLFVMVSRFFMMTSGVMVILPGFGHVFSLSVLLCKNGWKEPDAVKAVDLYYLEINQPFVDR